MMTEASAGVTGGVDTHAQVHVAAAVCSTSQQLLGTESFPATARGYRQLVAWLWSFGQID